MYEPFRASPKNMAMLAQTQSQSQSASQNNNNARSSASSSLISSTNSNQSQATEYSQGRAQGQAQGQDQEQAGGQHDDPEEPATYYQDLSLHEIPLNDCDSLTVPGTKFHAFLKLYSDLAPSITYFWYVLFRTLFAHIPEDTRVDVSSQGNTQSMEFRTPIQTTGQSKIHSKITKLQGKKNIYNSKNNSNTNGVRDQRR